MKGHQPFWSLRLSAAAIILLSSITISFAGNFTPIPKIRSPRVVVLWSAKLFFVYAYNFAEVVVYRLAAIDCRQAVIAILNKPNVYKAAGRFRGAECPQSSRAEAAPKPAASTIGVRAPRRSHPTKEGTPNLKPVADRQF